MKGKLSLVFIIRNRESVPCPKEKREKETQIVVPSPLPFAQNSCTPQLQIPPRKRQKRQEPQESPNPYKSLRERQKRVLEVSCSSKMNHHFAGFSTLAKSLLSKVLSSGLTILSFCAVVVVVCALPAASEELAAAAACLPSCPTAAAP